MENLGIQLFERSVRNPLDADAPAAEGGGAMLTCEDCLHIEVCAYIKHDLPICSNFADNTRYVMREKGEWEGTNCSRCGGSYMDYADAESYPAIGEPKPDFCPNCGSDMRKEENDSV